MPLPYETAHLLVINLQKLASSDLQETQKLLEACEAHGFFYLDLKESEGFKKDWSSILVLMQTYFSQPLALKMQDAYQSDTWGYEPVGTSSGVNQKLDDYESLKISREEIKYSDQFLRTEIAKKNSKLFRRFMNEVHAITETILASLSAGLKLDENTALGTYHSDAQPSRTTLSLFRYPKIEPTTLGQGHNKHTDLGTLTLLLAKQWGLEILSSEGTGWKPVQPSGDYAIINVGDTLRFLTGKKLKSAVHRVVPTEELKHTDRFSIAYFLRAADDVRFFDSKERSFSAKDWHDTKFDVFRQSYEEQEAEIFLTGGMEKSDVLLAV
ncbi:putative 2og-fe oxygenase family protein [Botrytis fragariae]|uniref:Putative 2og-fe oxygenase family protein n=1 Tax=Botrytis fragariae TaxID=1964551 RepID=A0A8H6AT44_9HELO|nr:putative 2og-fe oxygenase family protein [Botrytis fragariae]KAF5873174.1 putative 2og-fe oxygenase family protein [Botrytis fragariae]